MSVSFKVIAGDFGKTDGKISPKGNVIKFSNGKPSILKSEIAQIMPASESNFVKAGGAAGWGIAGGLLFGPAGLLAGAVLGGRGKKTAFIILCNDGQKVLGECASKDFPEILGMSF